MRIAFVFGALVFTLGMCMSFASYSMDAVIRAAKIILLGSIIMLAAAMFWARPVHSRDLDGRFAAANPELHQWFESLRSIGKSPCCADADGYRLDDPDVDTVDNHYRVRIEGEWVDVPPESIVTTPNRVGYPMVWKRYIDGHPAVRCFMPGPMG